MHFLSFMCLCKEGFHKIVRQSLGISGEEYAEANKRHGPCPQEAFSQFRR